MGNVYCLKFDDMRIRSNNKSNNTVAVKHIKFGMLRVGQREKT